jgi:hypothetical protein
MVNNTLSSKGFYEFIQPWVGNDTEKLKVVVEILKTCQVVTDSDRCEASAKISACIANFTEIC